MKRILFINDIVQEVVQDASRGRLLIIIIPPGKPPAEFPDGVACAFYKEDRSKWSWYHGRNLILASGM